MDKLTETTIATLAYDRDRWKQRAESLEAEIERLKAEQDNPNPLTLDELRERDGKPVYLVVPTARKHKAYWAIQTGHRQSYYPLVFDYTAYHKLSYALSSIDYGKTWLAYDRPPKEDEHD